MESKQFTATSRAEPQLPLATRGSILNRRDAKKGLRIPRILIRCGDTKCYWGETDWVTNSASARCFSSALGAELYCREMEFTGMELVVFRQGRPPLVVRLQLP